MLLTARYVLPVSAPHIQDGAVLIADGKIVEVGEAEALMAAHPDEDVRDLGLAALMPGFVDLHTHLEYSAMRGLVDDLPYSQWKIQVMGLEERLDDDDWADASQLGVLEALQSGITTVADSTDTGASVQAVVDSGMRGFLYREVSTMEKSEIDDVMASAAEDIAAWRGLGDDDLLTVGISPHSPYSCHPELFSRVAEEATRSDLPVTIHLAGSRDEYDFVKYGSSRLAVDFRDQAADEAPGWLPTGVSPVRYVLQWGLLDVPNVLAVHCTQVDEEDVEILAAHDVAIAYCPRCNAKLGMGIAPLARFLRSGIRIGIGTDSPASNNTMDMFDEMRTGLLLQRSLSGHQQFYIARQFVKLATLDAARALGIDSEVGSLEPGKRADIVAVDISHSHQIPTQHPYSTLVHTANQENVILTMVDGEILYDQGSWSSLDSERTLSRAQEMRNKLRG